MLNNLVQANMAEVGNTHVYALRKFANLFYIKQLKNFQIKKKGIRMNNFAVLLKLFC